MRGGFTLIELLMVIAIVSLLASILLPSLNRAKKLAQQVTCAANLKNVGSAMCMYTIDHNGYLPPCYIPGSVIGNFEHCYWAQLLMPYAGDTGETFVCPNYFVNRKKQTKYNWYFLFAPGGQSNRYGYNHRALGCGGYASGFGCVSNGKITRLASVPRADFVMCLDNAFAFATSPESYGGNPERYKEVYLPEEIRHNNGINILFVDGSVSWASIDSAYFDYGAEEYWEFK